jgi:hypothetical protein
MMANVLLSRAMSSSNTPPLTKQRPPSRTQTARSYSSRKSPSTSPLYDRRRQARGVHVTMTGDKVGVALAERGAEVPDVMVRATTWKTRTSNKEHPMQPLSVYRGSRSRQTTQARFSWICIARGVDGTSTPSLSQTPHELKAKPHVP